MLESPNTSNEDSTSQPKPNEDSAPKSRKDQIDEVAKILAGDDDKSNDDQGNQDGDDKSAAPNEDSKKAKPKTLDEIATALEIDVKDLYDIAIKQAPGPDGEDRSVTLGKLADLAKETGQFELDRIEFEESKTTREAEFMRAQQQLNEIISMLPKRAISADLVKAVATKMAETQERERGLTLSAIPEWKDESVEETERKAISKSLSEYGFSAGYLDTVQDHRTLKYIRDNWQRAQRMERALAAMRKKPQQQQRPSKSAGAPKKDAPGTRRARSGPQARDQKVAAVADLLRTNEG